MPKEPKKKIYSICAQTNVFKQTVVRNTVRTFGKMVGLSKRDTE